MSIKFNAAAAAKFLVVETIRHEIETSSNVAAMMSEYSESEIQHALNGVIDDITARMADGIACPNEAIFFCLGHRLSRNPPARSRKSIVGKQLWQNELLYYFSRFCGSANREIIQAMQRDFMLETRDMRKAQHNKWFIATALTWRALFGGILPIMADGLLRLIKLVKEAKDIAKKSGD